MWKNKSPDLRMLSFPSLHIWISGLGAVGLILEVCTAERECQGFKLALKRPLYSCQRLSLHPPPAGKILRREKDTHRHTHTYTQLVTSVITLNCSLNSSDQHNGTASGSLTLFTLTFAISLIVSREVSNQTS